MLKKNLKCMNVCMCSGSLCPVVEVTTAMLVTYLQIRPHQLQLKLLVRLIRHAGCVCILHVRPSFILVMSRALRDLCGKGDTSVFYEMLSTPNRVRLYHGTLESKLVFVASSLISLAMCTPPVSCAYSRCLGMQ